MDCPHHKTKEASAMPTLLCYVIMNCKLRFHSLLLILALRISGFHERIDEAAQSDENQRDAKPLSIVQHMTDLALHLNLLEELNDKTGGENHGKRDAGSATRRDLALREFKIIDG